MNNSYAHHVDHNILLNGIPRTSGEDSDQQHCSAMEIFPDHSHVNMFPVNCTTKYWSRVLCEDRNMNTESLITSKYYLSNRGIYLGKTVHPHKNEIKGVGEYWINDSTLYQREYLCPDGFNFVAGQLCLQLLLLENNLIKQKYRVDRVDFVHGFLYENTICNSTRTPSVKSIDYVVADILEEFYPEGSDAFLYHTEIMYGHWMKTGGAVHGHFMYFLPPPHYSTYVPCIRGRQQVSTKNAISASIYTCNDGSVIPDMLVCNGVFNCKNSEDERHCPVCPGKDAPSAACLCDVFLSV